MSATELHRKDPAVIDGYDDAPIEQIEFFMTDDELQVLLGDDSGALAKLFPEGEQELPVAVERAVKRSLVARRVLMTLESGHLDLVEPYAGLTRALTTGTSFVRITSDQDDQRARLVFLLPDAVFTLDRDPNGINTVTITRTGYAAEIVAASVEHVDGVETDPSLLDTEPVRLAASAVQDGRQLLSRGALAEAEEVLGAAYPLVVGADRVFRVETMHLVDGTMRGDEFDILDAGDLGWLAIAHAEDDDLDVVVRQLSDEDLLAAIAAAVAGP